MADLQAANRHLSAALHNRDSFLATMSHELRTPLSSILGVAEILQEEIYGTVSPRQHHALTIIHQNGAHLLSLINDLLDLAKIEAGREQLVLADVQAAELIADSLSVARPLARQRQVRLIEPASKNLPMMRADTRRIKQILVNLLSNAIKFTPVGGEVGIDVDVDSERDTVRFHVWDTGVGIPPDQLSRLFQPFMQLSEDELSRDQGGTGLGLALVARLAEMHGGGVTMRSLVGKGSSFYVTLPRLAINDFDMPEALDAHSDPAPLVLVAGGERASAAYLAWGLREAGYRCAIVEDGMATLERARAEPPVALLIDRRIADLGSLEALHRLRADPALAGVPAILIGSTTTTVDAVWAQEAGATAYVSRPIHMPDLLAIMATAIGSLSKPSTLRVEVPQDLRSTP
ncbi:MAG: response regulator [Oscillochloris sp.]|nr:response regulator [Oscillochloris sp.]